MKSWPELIPDVQLAMNNKCQASTKHTPFELMYGGNARTQYNAVKVTDQNQQPTCGVHPLHEETELQKQTYIDAAQSNLKESAEKMKKQYDERAWQNAIEVGDQVYVKKHFVKKGESKKLSPLYDNLSVVVEADMPLLKIKNVSTGRVQWRHHNQLKKHHKHGGMKNNSDIRVTFSNQIDDGTDQRTTFDMPTCDDNDLDLTITGDELSQNHNSNIHPNIHANPNHIIAPPQSESLERNIVSDERIRFNPNHPPCRPTNYDLSEGETLPNETENTGEGERDNVPEGDQFASTSDSSNNELPPGNSEQLTSLGEQQPTIRRSDRVKKSTHRDGVVYY